MTMISYYKYYPIRPQPHVALISNVLTTRTGDITLVKGHCKRTIASRHGRLDLDIR